MSGWRPSAAITWSRRRASLERIDSKASPKSLVREIKPWGRERQGAVVAQVCASVKQLQWSWFCSRRSFSFYTTALCQTFASCDEFDLQFPHKCGGRVKHYAAFSDTYCCMCGSLVTAMSERFTVQPNHRSNHQQKTKSEKRSASFLTARPITFFFVAGIWRV